jgi:hypothetical protein
VPLDNTSLQAGSKTLKFKFRVPDSIGNQWERSGGKLSIREWFKKTIDGIDAILGSLIDAAGGAGGILKNSKMHCRHWLRSDLIGYRIHEGLQAR